MIRHDDKLVKQNSSLLAIVEEDIQQELGSKIIPEDGASLPCDGGDENVLAKSILES
jgi:hypothetical protein